MCRSRPACTELYATVAGVGFVMRAKTEPAGRVIREMARLAKEPGFFSTLSSRVRSGLTQAGIVVLVWKELVILIEDFWGCSLPFAMGEELL